MMRGRQRAVLRPRCILQPGEHATAVRCGKGVNAELAGHVGVGVGCGCRSWVSMWQWGVQVAARCEYAICHPRPSHCFQEWVTLQAPHVGHTMCLCACGKNTNQAPTPIRHQHSLAAHNNPACCLLQVIAEYDRSADMELWRVQLLRQQEGQ